MSRLDFLIRFAYDNFSGGIPPFPDEEVEEARAAMNFSPMAFFDCFVRRVAHEYFEEKMSFEVADYAMNSLDVYCLTKYAVSLPSYARNVYYAFDQGEFFHREDGASVDPELKYTKPQIEAVVVRDRILGTQNESA